LHHRLKIRWHAYRGNRTYCFRHHHRWTRRRTGRYRSFTLVNLTAL